MPDKKDRSGAESLVQAFVDAEADVCFANPGTSEMHFVAALDNYKKMRSILCLFEGCATGAADGYFRMKRTPASTCLLYTSPSPRDRTRSRMPSSA